jgi:DNA-binding transcriptional LysR family regulator
MNFITKRDAMNLHHLSIFKTVCEEGGISRGAERLMISQPAVSKQLQQLEQSLGVQLMDRLPSGVRLTQAGELLLDHARRLFAVESEAEQALAQLRGLHRGRLAVGASMTVGVYLLPELLAKFRRTHPSIELQCEIGNTKHIQQLLLHNVVDVGLTEGFVESPDLLAEVFQTDELVAITKPDHPLQRRKNVTLDMFLREPLIVREIGSGTRAVIERALAQRGMEMKPAFTLANTEAIKRTVTAGIGVAIVSSLAIQTELATGQLAILNVKNLSVRRPLHCLEVRGKTRSPAIEAFLEKLSA